MFLSRGRLEGCRRRKGLSNGFPSRQSPPAARVWGHLAVLRLSHAAATSKARLEWWSPSHGSLDTHHTPSLLPTLGSTSKAAKMPDPGATLPVPLCFHRHPPLHTCAPNHCLWLSAQTPRVPGCPSAPAAPFHRMPTRLATSCSSPASLYLCTPESCFLLAWQLWTSSGPGKPVNFSASQWSAILFSHARSEPQHGAGLPFQACHSLGALPQPEVIIQKFLISYSYHSLLILYVYQTFSI